MFGCHGKYYFPENDFRLTNIFTFDPEIIFSPHFHFKAFLEKERERERERERPCARRRSPVRRTARDRDLAIDGATSRHHEITQLIAILPSTEITIDGAISARSRSRDRRRDLAPSRDRTVDRDLAFDRDRNQRRDLATHRSRDRAGAIS